MERSRGVTVYGIALIAFGIYNLLGVGNFKQFSLMFEGLAQFIIIALYIFTVFYGICGVYCGIKILKLEDWARKVMVALAAVSVILGFILNKTVLNNFKEFLSSGQAQVPPEMLGGAYRYAVIFIILVTIFELSVIFFFTRPGVIRQFRSNEEVHTT
jgi:hypothetical protein